MLANRKLAAAPSRTPEIERKVQPRGVFSGDMDSAHGQMLSAAITYELEKSQRNAGEKVVPW